MNRRFWSDGKLCISDEHTNVLTWLKVAQPATSLGLYDTYYYEASWLGHRQYAGLLTSLWRMGLVAKTSVLTYRRGNEGQHYSARVNVWTVTRKGMAFIDSAKPVE